MSDNLLTQGIQAAQAGDTARAQTLLVQAVRQSPNSAQAWHWLAVVLDDPEKKKVCLERAAALDIFLPDEPVDRAPTSPLETEQAAQSSAPFIVLDAGIATPPSELAANQQAIKGRPLSWQIVAGIAGVGLLLLCIFGAAFFLLAYHPDRLKNQSPAIAGNSLLPTDTQRALPTIIPSETPAPMPTRTPPSTSTPAATLDETQMVEHLSVQITAAKEVLDSEQDMACIQNYDKLLAEMPNWPIGYYNRGICERFAQSNATDLGEYIKYKLAAIRDQDKAISLRPDYANAYVERGLAYADLTSILENNNDIDAGLKIALDNVRTGQALGSKHSGAEYGAADIYLSMGRCQESITEFKRLIAARPTGNLSASMYEELANGYLCIGEYALAYDAISTGLKIGPCCGAIVIQGSALIGMGNLIEAFRVVDQDIHDSPSYRGYRYYLRALLYFDRGEFDLASQDLDMGSGNVWFHGGLYAYTRGLLALHEGDRERAIEWLQYAASSVTPQESLWLKQRIHRDMDKLNAIYMTPTPEYQWEITPLAPARPTTFTPTLPPN